MAQRQVDCSGSDELLAGEWEWGHHFSRNLAFGLCVVLCSGCLDKIHSLGGLNNRYVLKATHP